MPSAAKNWDDYVAQAEEVARTSGFQDLRERILALARPQPCEVVVDIGAGTGLLTLPIAAACRQVWAVDISAAMTDYLRAKADSAGLGNVHPVTASAISLPLVDGTADLVVSNYCFHHLDATGKDKALSEVHRVLRPGGRVVFGDMMFRVSVADARDRRVVIDKVQGMIAKGPKGVWRLARNGLRFATGRWESPARADWWQAALQRHGFQAIEIHVMSHEGGIAAAQRPSQPVVAVPDTGARTRVQ